MKRLLFFLLMLPVFFSSYAQEITGAVMSVENGYCFTLLGDDNQQYNVRLYGLYGPNKGQPFYKDAKEYLQLLLDNQEVKIVTDQKDRYGRMVGKVYCNGQYINSEMISTGNAWWDEINADEDKELQLAEQEAAFKRIGLWLYHKAPLDEELKSDNSQKVLEIGKPADTDKSGTGKNKDDMQLMDKDGKVDVIKTFRELGKAYENIDE